MVAIITDKFRIQQAKDFLEQFQTAAHPSGYERNHYLFVARSREWSNETQPPTPLDTNEADFRIWDEILGLKKVSQTNGSHVIPRQDWDTSGNTVYFPYDDRDANLFYHPTEAEVIAAGIDYTPGTVYVITDEFHVFKCLDNNRGTKSTVKPTLPLAAPYIVNTSDGYFWKYLYTLSGTDISKFLTDSWIPVKVLSADDGSDQWDVQQAAVEGQIDACLIDSGGTGYTNIHSGTVQNNPGMTTTVVLPASASATDGAYTNASMYITGGSGLGNSPRRIANYVGATRTVTLASGFSISIDNTTTYDILPTVTLSGDGSNATVKPLVHTSGPNIGQLKQILMLSKGTNYHYASALIEGGLGLGGVHGIIHPVMSPEGGNGKNAVKELGGFFAMLNIRLEYNEGAGDFPIANDYRKLGLVRDVKQPNDSLATATTLQGQKTLVLTGVVGTFLPDEDIVGVLSPNPNATGNIVSVFGNDLVFFQDPITGYVPFLDGMVVTGQTSGATGTIDISGVLDPEVKKYSGEILYVEHRRPVVRDAAQIEDIKTIIEF